MSFLFETKAISGLDVLQEKEFDSQILFVMGQLVHSVGMLLKASRSLVIYMCETKAKQ